MKRSPLPRLLLSTLLLLALLAACGGEETTPIPTAEPRPTFTPVPEPTAVEPEEGPETVATEAVVTNAVAVDDQGLDAAGTVTIAAVTVDVDGWIVIHAQADEAPGPILGYAPVRTGENRDVIVEIDRDGATATLYAMLHVDAGTAGEYEFPGADGPALDADGNVVTPPSAITGGLSTVPLLDVAESADLGVYLVDEAGLALYTFSVDDPDVSNCYERCAVAWPPLLIEAGREPTAVAELTGVLGITERTDGSIQVTYDGWPLYYWIDDAAPGDTTGHNVGNIWAVARAETTVIIGAGDDLGLFLAGADGMTLYRFNPDEPNVSNCYDQCATNWPPLLVQAGEIPVGGFGVSGELGVTERDDGTYQVTYNGEPLYYWINDEVPGDTTGHEVNDVWFVVAP